MKRYIFLTLLSGVFTSVFSQEDDKTKIKLEGDRYFENSQLENAAKEYRKILDIVDKLPKEERFKIAKVLSWTGNLKESVYILDKLYNEYPDDRDIALHFARVLSWSGDFSKSLIIVDKLLLKNPDDVEALLIKANILRWQGNLKESINLYQKILSLNPENFDVKISYGYALLSVEDRLALEELLKSISPFYEYQKKEFSGLKSEYINKFNPSLFTGYSYYHDSDHNNINKLNTAVSLWIQNVKTTIDYRKYWAKGSVVDSTVDEISINLEKRLSLNTKGSIYLGNITTKGLNDRSSFIYGSSLYLNIYKGSVGLNINSRILTDTSLLISNHIRVTSLSAFVNQSPIDKLNVYSSVSYRTYSDGNNAVFFQIAPAYRVFGGNPNLSIGYRFIYLSFDKQKFKGYFDPENYISNQLFFSFYYEKNNLILYLEPYVGQQSFKRYGKSNTDTIMGGFGSIDYKISDRLRFTGSLEGGNYSLGTASGWKYFIVGVGFKYIF